MTLGKFQKPAPKSFDRTKYEEVRPGLFVRKDSPKVEEKTSAESVTVGADREW